MSLSVCPILFFWWDDDILAPWVTIERIYKCDPDFCLFLNFCWMSLIIRIFLTLSEFKKGRGVSILVQFRLLFGSRGPTLIRVGLVPSESPWIRKSVIKIITNRCLIKYNFGFDDVIQYDVQISGWGAHPGFDRPLVSLSLKGGLILDIFIFIWNWIVIKSSPPPQTGQLNSFV